MIELVNLTEENFAEETTSELPVVIDFYADWCQPCQALMPTVHHFAEKYEGKIKFCKVNIQDNRKLAISNQVMPVTPVPTHSALWRQPRPVISRKRKLC